MIADSSEINTLEFLAEYGLFFAKTFTLIIGVLILLSGVVAIASRNKRGSSNGQLEVTRLNDEFRDMVDQLKSEVLDEEQVKAEQKRQKKEQKDKKKQAKQQAKKLKSQASGASETEADKASDDTKPRVYVLDFDGDIRASAVDTMREEISAVLGLARPKDEVLVRLESGGGMVHSYGLAASQLQRIRNKGIPLTVSVDKVAASGGYMMACIGDRILAAPFAILGSIGVVAQLPNFHRLLKKNHVDVELLTAGEHKRTLTMFGENTEKGRQKFMEELEDTHGLFKEFVSEHRPQLDMETIATGEVWFGKRALDQQLVDELKTSDEYLFDLKDDHDIFQVSYVYKRSLQEKLGLAAEQSADRLLVKWWGRMQQVRLFS
ncbi:protease SohB [Aestuariirhabdus sp. Z084]|uniref:protease SohB n=1 Tax=Aestuariirhabdus haliotis TaxID=2918751 RepID=UPI00201B39CA|nr:protease SohB [Aestuariirhabdus haliotis]MCL6414587.1 protease SohB [Aestuariirhabdus haliotis]MCL6418431.1 protease SohB [Aestuariirhabdus haliotis]